MVMYATSGVACMSVNCKLHVVLHAVGFCVRVAIYIASYRYPPRCRRVDS